MTTIAAVRRLCMALPESEERPFGGHTSPAFRVRDKMFCVVAESRRTVSLKAGPGVQEALVSSDPERYFRPPYVGPKGWVGVVLAGADDDELGELIRDSYRLVAPKQLAERAG